MRLLVLIPMLLFLPTVTVGQIQATTDAGKKVQLNADGTWKFLETPDVHGTTGDCSQLIERKTDKMTDFVTVGIKDPFIVKKNEEEGIVFYAAKREEEKVMVVLGLAGVGCVEKNSKVIILFRDGRKMELTGFNDFNCDGRIFLSFAVDDDEVISMATRDISTVRAYASKGFIDVDFQPDQSKSWKQSIQCLIDARIQN